MEDALKQKQESRAALEEAIDRSFAAARRLVAVRKADLVCAKLLLVMAANLFTSISRKSITNDEIVHIPAGYYHLVAGKFQLNNEHPPLVKMWAVLPLPGSDVWQFDLSLSRKKTEPTELKVVA